MRLQVFPLFALLLALGAVSEEEEVDDSGVEEDGFVGGSDHGAEDQEPTQSVYVMEHGFLSGEAPKWTPRGTLLLSGAPGSGYEARLSDAKEFVELKPELQPMMTKATHDNRYYAIRMYSPEKPKHVLQASIPARLLADHFEDWHDILEVTVGSTGAPVSLSYRVRNTLGLALFDHTQVHIAEPFFSEGPHIHASARSAQASGKGAAAGPDGAAAKGEEPATTPQSFLRKYWWVVIIVLLLLSSAGGEEPAGGGKASGGGAKK